MIRVTPYLKFPKIIELGRLFGNSMIQRLENMSKRAFDLVSALVGLIFLSPVFLVISLCIRRDSPGPVFYHGPRAGKSGRAFQILKFRTMYECIESYAGPRVTCNEDPRITPFGHWLRDSKINELPQLWNVLVGEMSLVGPRPEDVDIAETWPASVRREILSVRPGITSPASILYRDEENLLSSNNLMGDYFMSILPDKIRLDQLYVRNRSLLVDLDTIFWTIFILIPRIVKARIPEGYLFAGPFSRLIGRDLSWFVTDLFVSLFAGASAALLWRIQEPLNWGLRPMLGLAILIAFLFSGINVINGLNRVVWAEAYAEDGALLGLSAAFVTFVICLLNYLQDRYLWLPYPSLPITMIFTIGLMSSIGFVVTRYRSRLLTGLVSRWMPHPHRASGAIERVLIIGSGEAYQLANWLLKQGDGSRILSIVGVVDDEEPAMLGMRLKGNLMLGGTNDLPALIKKYDVGVVLFAVSKATPEFQQKIEDLCKTSGSRLVMLTDLLDILHKQLTQPIRQREITPSGL
jgi:lipopolysaccharide/colanic/teichoic acid biosynthesis glycosyltransferase